MSVPPSPNKPQADLVGSGCPRVRIGEPGKGCKLDEHLLPMDIDCQGEAGPGIWILSRFGRSSDYADTKDGSVVIGRYGGRG